MSHNIKEIRELLAVMHEFKVKKLDTGIATLELHESAFDHSPGADVPADAKKALFEPEDLCSCGCPKDSAHSRDGCLNGCSVASCTVDPSKPPQE